MGASLLVSLSDCGAQCCRFQHAVGVAYLAEQFVYKLVKNNRSLQGKVDWRDVLCVKVAGLCHDLGHGPFSHAFDDVFMERLKSERSNGHGNGHGNGTMSGEDDEVKPWKHEEMSCLMLEHLLKVGACGASRPQSTRIAHKLSCCHLLGRTMGSTCLSTASSCLRT